MIDVHRDDERRRLFAVATGTVSFAEVVEAIERQRAANAWQYSVLYDLRAVASTLTADDIRALATVVEHIGSTQDRGPVAIVATDTAIYSLACLYAILTKRFGVRMEVFRDIDEAEAWLARF